MTFTNVEFYLRACEVENKLGTGRDDITHFTADFWGDKVFISDRVFPSGHFIVSMLNSFSTIYSWFTYGTNELKRLQEDLQRGFIYEKDFNQAKNVINDLLENVRKLEPFSFIDANDYESFRLARLFREDETVYTLQRFFSLRSTQAENSYCAIYNRREFNEEEKKLWENGSELLPNFSRAITFYAFLVSDILKMCSFVRNFIEEQENMAVFDENNLIQKISKLSTGCYSEFEHEDSVREHLMSMKADIEYIPLKVKGKYVTARRMHFKRYADFLIADFFEGIHNGHYPRQCKICESFFLVENGHPQKYCDGIDPNDEEKRPCRKVAADRNRREREYREDHPIIRTCTTRINTIWTHKSKGKISEEFAAAAKRLAQDCRDRAMVDYEYAQTQYENDMTQEAIYSATRKLLGE
jgi:hypothetical protein